MKKVLIAVLLACAAGAAQAETWRVDVLIFAHADSIAGEQGLRATVLADERAIPLDDAARLQANGISLLPAESSALGSQWQRLRNATAFRPLLRLSWLQRNPPQRGGPALLLRHGGAMRTDGGESIRQLEGTLRLTLRRFLHLDADLRWHQQAAGSGVDNGFGDLGSVLNWPLQEQRRMRSDELHYLDSAGIGLLAKIQRSQ